MGKMVPTPLKRLHDAPGPKQYISTKRQGAKVIN